MAASGAPVRSTTASTPAPGDPAPNRAIRHRLWASTNRCRNQRRRNSERPGARPASTGTCRANRVGVSTSRHRRTCPPRPSVSPPPDTATAIEHGSGARHGGRGPGPAAAMAQDISGPAISGSSRQTAAGISNRRWVRPARSRQGRHSPGSSVASFKGSKVGTASVVSNTSQCPSTESRKPSAARCPGPDRRQNPIGASAPATASIQWLVMTAVVMNGRSFRLPARPRRKSFPGSGGIGASAAATRGRRCD